MNAYTRSTRECAFVDMRPELATAIRKHVEKYKTGMFVTTQLLVWTVWKKKDTPFVRSALLCNIDAQDFENTAMYQVNPDFGINVTGRYTDVTKQGQTFIGLGSNPAGEKFRQVLQHAMQKAQV